MANNQLSPYNHNKLGVYNNDIKQRTSSAPYSVSTASNGDDHKVEHSSAFPRTCQHCGYLDVRTTEQKPWKRRYFVVNNNFLLSAATPHAKRLDRVIPLEGSNIRSTNKSSDMTFELFIRKHRLFFRCASPKQCTKWANAIEKASKLKIKDIYRFNIYMYIYVYIYK